MAIISGPLIATVPLHLREPRPLGDDQASEPERGIEQPDDFESGSFYRVL